MSDYPADFLLAVNWTLEKEGVFADHAKDPGGKTIYGVASKFWPQWYARIMANTKPEARKAVAIQFYFEEFWSRLRPDLLESRWVKLALFDMAVHMSTGHAVTIAQQAVNLNARNNAWVGELTEDGKMGPFTAKALNRLYQRGPMNLIGAMHSYRTQRYFELYRNATGQYGPFIWGWMLRLFMPPEFYEEVSR